MKIQAKKVKIISMKPHKVVIEFVETKTKVMFPRKAFEQRLEIGLFELVGPVQLPNVL